ncbi:uncharacterized protein LOC128794136 isoform X3 [Vidua chalybeata]|uniref:uncharacterized protein LOC128794136 isoform X3 n=1 Tax=Vidua chalybeata TaxID=81927 RepID=UPI0023A8B8F0|nr:uncharacterized protein LOC128794136 isoform X3 [Vidua chalybeata]
MALALRLFLPLLLAVALLARAAQAAPLQARGADWDHDLDYLEVLMNDGLKFLEDVGAEPVAEGGAASQPIPSTDPLGDAEVTGVSAERTFPGSLVEVAHKPSSHHKGPQTEKIKDTANKISLEPSELMWQMLREMLQGGQDMEGEAVQKEAFPRGSSDSVPASAAGREAMPGTVTGDEVDGKAPPLAWLNEVLKPLEPPAAVSAGRNFPAPLLIAPRKPGSLRRGPPRGKNKPRGEKESLESNNILKQIVKKLHKGHEMEGEAVLKAEFPGGTSGSLAASAAGREAMPGTVTGDWDHKLDYLEALLENGLKILEDVGAEPVAEGGAASQPIPSTDPLGDAEGVSAGRTSPAPGLDAAHQQTSRRRGPPKGKTQDTAATKSHESNEFLRQTQKEAQGGQVMDQTSLQKEAHPGGSSGSVAAPAAGRKAMPGTGTGTGDAASTTAPVPDSQKGIGRGFCHGTGYWLGLMAGMLLLELVCMLCCFRIWYSWKRKCRSSGQEMKGGGFPSHPDCLWSTSSSNKGLVSPFWSSEQRTPVDLSTRISPKTL